MARSYTALYRKFRPHRFEDVKGQDPIVATLKNQIKAGRIGHAYLFCGTRGTGKTSVAKIFAKAANCEQPIEGSPCGECVMCRTIAAGASMNVMEIDAASNNGVDNIREIVDEVAYSPAEGKYKVYIIDEVHMLSIGAFNALLKTLEEPPEYVIFILATTEVHKIPVTIMSRCQRYDFKRITVETISEVLTKLMAEEQIKAEEKAIHYIAKSADGALRDALSLLDQCIAFYFGQELTYDKVLEVLGAVDTEVFSRLFRACLEGNVTGGVELLEEIVMQGRELGQFIVDFTWYLRNLLLMKTSDGSEDVIDASAENMARLKEEAQIADVNIIMRYIRIFSELSGQIKYATQKRVLIEMALIKLCKPGMETDNQSLLDRIRQLEDRLESGVLMPAQAGDNLPAGGLAGSGLLPDSPPAGKKTASVASRPALPKAIPQDVEKIVSSWPGILSRIPMPMKSYMKGARLSLGDDSKLLIVVEDGLASDYLLKQPEHQQQLETILSAVAGKAIEVHIRSINSDHSFDSTYIDLTQIIHMDIEEDDE